MICKDTIEEKMVTLQLKKKKVASQLIQVDESVFKNMNKDDLMALFE
jgi:SNF2 family DNA or RNA helicase